MKVSVPGLEVAAFGPFGKFETNPSTVLAHEVFADVRDLQVSFEAVDRWLDELDDGSRTHVIAIGVHKKATTLRLERIGRNVVGEAADVLGKTREPGPIVEDGPSETYSGLWSHPSFAEPGAPWEMGDDSGTYLCNYLSYRMYGRFPDRPYGFIHIPTFEQMALTDQKVALRALVELVVSIPASVPSKQR